MRAKLTITLLGLILASANCFAAYSYYLNDPLTSINTTRWTNNGPLTTGTSGPLTNPNYSLGGLVSKLSVPDGTSNYEVKITLKLAADGGDYGIFLRANTYLSTYYMFDVSSPAFGSDGSCSATLTARIRSGGLTTVVSSTSVPCRDGMVVRAIIRGTILRALVDDVEYLSFPDSTISTGKPGVGMVYQTPSGNGISSVSLGGIDQTAPATPDLTQAATLVLPNRIDMQWPGSVDNTNGIGVEYYQITRDGVLLFEAPEDLLVQGSRSPEFSDGGVSPGTTYTYGISACDFHGNCSAEATKAVTSAPAGAVDARRVGVRPDGTYWGAGGEQIDTRSGNLNFSIPLIKAAGRNGGGVAFGLSYNSQLWRQDGTTTWELGRDVGYGFGWKIQAGSITPYWSDYLTLHHYVYTNSSGAEYVLNVNTNGIWTSTETGVYFEYDAANKRLYFPDGTFWIMGATSSGLEVDAGTLYPTVFEDTNGNYITVTYKTGSGAAGTNTSARLYQISDVRTGGSATYTLNWSGGTLISMTNSIGTAEYFVFSMGTATRLSPFDGTTSFGTKQVLNSISRTNPGTGEGTGLAHSFSYNDYGELLSVGLPYGGTLRWTYRTFTYSGSRSLREVQSRYLTMSPGGSEIGYGFSFDDTAGSTLHSWGKLTNPGGAGREWYFSNGTNGPLGVLWRFEAGTGFPSSPSPMVRRDFSYSQDSASRYYISSVVKTIDPGGANPLQSKTWQQLNSHGNVTQSKIYDYGNLTTPVRTFTNTFWTNSTQHIWNRLHTSGVTDGTNQVTLVNNRYDLYDLTDYSPFTIPSHDSAYDASFTARGNLSESTSFGTVHHFSYDIAGNTLAADDTHGHGVSSSYSGATQYAVPDSISPNGDDTLATDYTYSSFLGISGVDTPDMSASMDYDSFGRPATAHSPYGATTTYAYDGDNVRLITATTGSKIVKTTMDGLGRTVKVETGDSTGTKLVVETVYDYCACSPLGKVKKVSRPYKPSATVYWTEYEYDALGRTTRVTLPDGSYSTFAFSGNTTTVTDPAAHSKTYKRDVLGNLTEVDEPAPEGGTHVTSYTYNLLGKLAQVSMARGGATQTRTFSYDLSTGRLSYVQNPESGRVDFTYNIDGTLQYKTDAKGQKVQFTYDSLGRVTVKQTYRSDQTEDLCGRVTNYWDTRPAGVGDQNWTNVKGRLMAVRWSDNSCTAKQFTEAYQYDTGEITIKRLYAPALAPQGEASYIDATFNYGDQGQLVSAAYPVWYGSQNKRWPLAVDAKTYTISYDMLMRLIGLSDGQNAIVHDVAYGSTDEVTAPAGQLSAFSYGSYTETLNYNARGQLTELKAASDGETMVDLQYVFAASPSNDGRITQMIDTVANETVNYQHDSLGRLTSADTPPGGAWGQTFTYDGFGNLTSEVATKDGSPIVYRNYDAATNRLLPSTDYTYDANGNLTAMPDLSMTYNVENRMVQVVNQEGTESYGYDPGGVQVWKLDKYNVMHVFFNGGEGKPMGDFYYDVSLQAARGGSPMVYFAGRRVDNDSVEDRLGTAVLDNGKKMSFYPYGMVRSNDDSSPVQYATYNRDALTNLDYAQQRYYSSQIGRFTTADPNTDPDWSNPQSLNQFTYVGGDPIDANDPEGLCAVMIAGITMDPERGSVWDSEAGVLRADTAYPYSGYSGFGPLKKVQSIFSVIRQGFGSNDSTAAALAAIRYALSSNAGLVDIIAYSGGAGAFTAAYGQLSDAEKNRIGYVLYLSPGAEGLIADAKGTTTAVVGSPFNVADDATVAFTTFPQDVPVIGSDCAHTDIACLFRAAKTFLRNINSNGPCNNPKVFTRTRPLGVPANFLSSRGWPPGYGLGGYWEWVPVYGSEGEIGGYVPVYWGPILPPRAFER